VSGRGIIPAMDLSSWMAVLGVALLICTPAVFGSPALRAWSVARLLRRNGR
jgi:hypothetical protein